MAEWVSATTRRGARERPSDDRGHGASIQEKIDAFARADPGIPKM